MLRQRPVPLIAALLLATVPGFGCSSQDDPIPGPNDTGIGQTGDAADPGGSSENSHTGNTGEDAGGTASDDGEIDWDAELAAGGRGRSFVEGLARR